MYKVTFIVIHLLVMIYPLSLAGKNAQSILSKSFINKFSDLPKSFNKDPLIQVALNEDDKRFLKDFPGEFARFETGKQQLIIRRILTPSRKLHPSSDCLQGSRYKVVPQTPSTDRQGNVWGCLSAEKDNKKFKVCEIIFEQRQAFPKQTSQDLTELIGKSYSDTSTWFWDATLSNTPGPWWAVTVIEPLQ